MCLNKNVRTPASGEISNALLAVNVGAPRLVTAIGNNTNPTTNSEYNSILFIIVSSPRQLRNRLDAARSKYLSCLGVG
jgi:hypothetical protein